MRTGLHCGPIGNGCDRVTLRSDAGAKGAGCGAESRGQGAGRVEQRAWRLDLNAAGYQCVLLWPFASNMT